METLFRYYVEEVNVERLYSNTFLKKIIYNFFYSMMYILIGGMILTAMITFGLLIFRYNSFMPRLLCIMLVMLSTLSVMLMLIIQGLKKYKDHCISISLLSQCLSSSKKDILNFELYKLLSRVKRLGMYELDKLMMIETWIENRIEFRISKHQKLFKLTSFIGTVILTLTITKVIELEEFKELYDLLNSFGYSLGLFIVAVLLAPIFMIIGSLMNKIPTYIQMRELGDLHYQIARYETKFKSLILEVQKLYYEETINSNNCIMNSKIL